MTLFNSRIEKLPSSEPESLATSPREKVVVALMQKEPLLEFAYLEQGALAWDKIRGKESFDIGGREIEALSQLCSEIEPALRAKGQAINLIHLGSGNGVELEVLLKMLNLSRSDSYAAVDVSRELLEILINNFAVFLDKVVGQSRYFLSDAKDPYHLGQICKELRCSNPGINVIVAAGEGTLISDANVLKNISRALGPDDYAIFSLDGCAREEIPQLCAQYNAPEVTEFLAHAIEYAIKSGALENEPPGNFLPAVYDEPATLLKVNYGILGRDPILVLRSLKPQTEAQTATIFRKSGLEPIKIVKTSRFSFGIACVRQH